MSTITVDRCMVLPKHSIDLILSGDKKWVLGARPTSIRGVVGLIDRETGFIHGIADVSGCYRKPFPNLESLMHYEHLHRVSAETIRASRGKCGYPWVVSNPLTIKSTVPSEKPKSSAIWVTGTWNLEQ